MAPPKTKKGRRKLGKRKRQRRKFVKGNASIKIHNTPKFFAPSVEDCLIKYTLERKGKSVFDKAKLVIKDKDGNVIHDDYGLMSLIGDGTHTTTWDGKDKNGRFANPLQSPFTVSIVMMNEPMNKDERIVKVEIKEINLWVDAPNNETFFEKPDHKVGTVATVSIKTKNNTGAVTEIPINVTFILTKKYYDAKKDHTYWEKHSECPLMS